MVAGIIVPAIADELPIAHPGGGVTAGTAAVILGGPARSLAGNAGFKWTVFHPGRGHGPWRSPSWS
jgi:low temperature requirement protein LtrA